MSMHHVNGSAVGLFFSAENPRPLSVSDQLYMAICKGQIAGVQSIWQEERVDVNQRRDCGNALFMVAVGKGHLNIVQFLVQKAGADINQCNAEGMLPIAVAAENGHGSVVKYLLKVGANLDSGEDEVPASVNLGLLCMIAKKNVAALLFAASYDPYLVENPLASADPVKMAEHKNHPLEGSAQVEAGRKLQMQWLQEGLSRTLTSLHAEIESIFMTAMSYPDPNMFDADAAAFLQVFTPLPEDLRFEINQRVVRRVVMALEQRERVEEEIDAEQGKGCTWVAAAARGRPVIGHLRFFPGAVRAEALRYITEEGYRAPTFEQLSRYNGKFSVVPRAPH